MSDWISVEDRLPPLGLQVLAIDRKGVCWVVLRGHGAWCGDDRIANITHWMPLPQPPPTRPA